MADGLCSADEDEDLDMDMHSPTDVSEDSVEVKVKPIIIGGCKKRKCAEPRKFGDEAKRRAVDLRESEYGPFRPWSQPPSGYVPRGYVPKVEERDQEEPLALVLRGRESDRLAPSPAPATAKCQPRPQEVVRIRPEEPRIPRVEESRIPRVQEDRIPRVEEFRTHRVEESKISRVQEDRIPRVEESRIHRVEESRTHRVEESRIPRVQEDLRIRAQEDLCDKSRTFSVESLIHPGPSSSTTSSIAGDKRKPLQQQRNYKNMTRERRIEANARERTRVHTISAAFDTLRRAVPAYSHNQKLSKLSVLRIACSYILTLSRVAGHDYSADNSQPSLNDCVENVSRTIQLEGKLRKKKDE